MGVDIEDIYKMIIGCEKGVCEYNIWLKLYFCYFVNYLDFKKNKFNEYIRNRDILLLYIEI